MNRAAVNIMEATSAIPNQIKIDGFLFISINTEKCHLSCLAAVSYAVLSLTNSKSPLILTFDAELYMQAS